MLSKKQKRKREIKATENWVELISHIDKSWMKKRNQDFGYPFTGKDFKEIKHFARIFRPWGLMALWDVYLRNPNEFNEKTGYSIFQFTRQLPFLVDDKGWKNAAREYERVMVRPLSTELQTVVDSLVKTMVGNES